MTTIFNKNNLGRHNTQLKNTNEVRNPNTEIASRNDYQKACDSDKKLSSHERSISINSYHSKKQRVVLSADAIMDKWMKITSYGKSKRSK